MPRAAARGRSGRRRTGRSSSAIPGPWSRTATSPSRTADLDRAAGRAPLRGVVEQVRDRALDRGRDAVHDRLVEVGRERRRSGRFRRVALDGVRGDAGRAARPRGSLARRLAARELDQLGDQRRHLAELLDDVASRRSRSSGRELVAAREHLDVRAQARQRRPQLVRRVGDELPLRAAESSSAASIVLKLAASRPSSSVAGRRRSAARGRGSR